MDLHIENTDALTFLRSQPNSSVQIFLVSPPYGSIRRYHGFTFDFEPIAKEMVRALADGGVIAWNEMDQQKDLNFSGDSFRHCLFFQSLGLKFADMIVIERNAFPYLLNVSKHWRL